MPPIAWVTIAVLWFGIGETSKVFIIIIGSFVPCLLNAYNGVRLVDPELYDVIRVLGGKRRGRNFSCVPSRFISCCVRRPADFPQRCMDLRAGR